MDKTQKEKIREKWIEPVTEDVEKIVDLALKDYIRGLLPKITEE